MENNNNWTKAEFKAYVLLYCAEADFDITKQEKDLILKIVNEEEYAKIHQQLEADNDFQRVEKITQCIKRFKYNTEDINALMNDMQTLFDCDGNFDILEKQLLMGLKRILKREME